ncbi:MAG: PAS domain-containing protein, partial [Planctomycetes bacterium]|nr:PAS domain-containing protein [Planctomycetota bacterium]
MRDRLVPANRSGVGLAVLGVGFAATYWVAHSAIQAFVFQRGSLLAQCLSRDASETAGRLLAVFFLISLGLIGGIRRRSRLAASRVPSSRSVRGATHRWTDSAVRVVEETEERYKTLVENIDIGISLIDKDYNVRMINKAQGELFDKPTCELVNTKCYASFEKRTETCPHCPGAVAMLTGRPAEVETFGVRDDGARFPVRLRAFPMKTPDGAVTGFIEVVQDITDRKQAEEALRESEARHRTLVEQLPAIIYTATLYAASTTTYVSPQVERILGFSPSDYQADPDLWRHRVHPDDRGRVLRELERCHAELRPFVCEYRMNTADGRVVWVRDSADVVRDENGRPLFLQGVMLDTTDLKQAEAGVRDREERLNLIVKGTQIGTWDWNVQTGETVFSDRWFEIIGYEPGELEPSTYQTWAVLVHPEDLKKAEAALEQHFAGKLDQYSVELRMKHKSGEWVWIQASGRVMEWTADRKPLRMLGMHEDITARKAAERVIVESEAKYRTLLEQIPAIIYTSLPDRPSVTLYVNSYVQQVLGYTPEEYEHRDLWEARLHPDDRDHVLSELAESVAAGRSFTLDYRMLARDGRTVWIRDEGVAVRDEAGRPLVIQGVMSDVT